MTSDSTLTVPAGSHLAAGGVLAAGSGGPSWPVGLLIVVGVLAVATAIGFVWRWWNGRMRVVKGAVPPDQSATGSDDGQETGGAVDGAPVDQALLASLGVEAGEPVTLLQFSSAFCAPCRATRQILGDVARTVEGVRHVEVDAESHLDAVRALSVFRTPTVLILDDGGRVVRRASGRPVKAQVMAVVTELLQATSDRRP